MQKIERMSLLRVIGKCKSSCVAALDDKAVVKR